MPCFRTALGVPHAAVAGPLHFRAKGACSGELPPAFAAEAVTAVSSMRVPSSPQALARADESFATKLAPAVAAVSLKLLLLLPLQLLLLLPLLVASSTA